MMIEESHCDPTLPGSVKPKGIVACDYVNQDPDCLDDACQTNHLSALQIVILVLVMAGLVWGTLGGGFAYLWKTNDTFRSFIAGTLGFSLAVSGGSLAEPNDEDEEDLSDGDEVLGSDDLALDSENTPSED